MTVMSLLQCCAALLVAQALGQQAVTCTAFQPVEDALNTWLNGPGLREEPTLLRMSFHQAGTFTQDTPGNQYGSNNDGLHYDVVQNYSANAGLGGLVDAIDAIYDDVIQSMCPQNSVELNIASPPISRADFYTLAGVVALDRMNGPAIDWWPGRKDIDNCVCNAGDEQLPPDGVLPAGIVANDLSTNANFVEGDHAETAKHNLDIFDRMGLNAQELVVLVGAHTMGTMNINNSGFGPQQGPPARGGAWARANQVFSNQFFVNMVNPATGAWATNNLPNNKQVYISTEGGQGIFMLPSDLALLSDSATETWARAYAADNDLFARDFAAAYSKILGLGVPRQACPAVNSVCASSG